jgi:hypothetical protein
MTDFDPTKPVRQRNGAEARILCVDSRATAYGSPAPILAEAKNLDGSWIVQLYRANGESVKAIDDGLVNIPERVSWFVPGTPKIAERPFSTVRPFSKEEAVGYSVNGSFIELIFEGDEFIEAKYHRS